MSPASSNRPRLHSYSCLSHRNARPRSKWRRTSLPNRWRWACQLDRHHHQLEPDQVVEGCLRRRPCWPILFGHDGKETTSQRRKGVQALGDFDKCKCRVLRISVSDGFKYGRSGNCCKRLDVGTRSSHHTTITPRVGPWSSCWTQVWPWQVSVIPTSLAHAAAEHPFKYTFRRWATPDWSGSTNLSMPLAAWASRVTLCRWLSLQSVASLA